MKTRSFDCPLDASDFGPIPRKEADDQPRQECANDRS
jgi:hypothetical protein